jgi:uncharacterized membrane protein YcaP (DUF421 family)
MDLLRHAFGGSGPISWDQECWRAVLVFCFGLALVRIAGRRAFAKWSALDIVVSIVVGSNLSRALTGNSALWPTLLATALLMALHLAFAWAAARARWLSWLVEGRAVTLGRQGRVEPGTLVRHAVSQADLDEALRSAGLESAEGARLVLLEPSGKISVLKRG